MSEGSLARIDRASLERIIRRAAELQAGERDAGESLSSDELIAVGKEVGIPARYLQQAILEERTRLTLSGGAGVLERVAGPHEVTAQRVVTLNSDEAEQRLIAWMDRNELLCIQRHQSGRITWEPLSGFQAAVRRSAAALGAGKRPFMLSRATTVAATIVALETGYVHVALSADVRKVRTEYLASSSAIAGAGAASTATMIALGALLPVALLPLPVAAGVGYSILRRHRPTASRIQLGLERALDSLENGRGKVPRQLSDRAGLLDLLTDELRKALKP
jgi:hypothetical protein